MMDKIELRTTIEPKNKRTRQAIRITDSCITVGDVIPKISYKESIKVQTSF